MVGSQPCAVNPPFHVNWRSPTLFSEASATVVFSASLIPKIPKLPNEEFPSGSSATQPFRELSISIGTRALYRWAPLSNSPGRHSSFRCLHIPRLPNQGIP